MASVFTYDPDPPRVSSPWLIPDDDKSQGSREATLPPTPQPQPGLLSEYGVTKLQAEPQEGPTEYKLHLLLRPRRAYISVTTANGVSRNLPREIKSPLSPSAIPSQPRQERLQHLTTQLLWRLQQSSPYHASSSRELVVPRLPDDSVDLNRSIQSGALVPGLEESRGALYEIGVSDDGTLVGLTKDEMDESINTLRVMAASLGCSVEVVRMIIVGECEWFESAELIDNEASMPVQDTKRGKLWVAEALVTPNLGLPGANPSVKTLHGNSPSTQVKTAEAPEPLAVPSRGSSVTPQLRVTLTGPTTSGKSSLLGTLSTGTLDNGRGKSRLSLLKHRHEMVSGVTSSIAQELIGYKNSNIHNFSHGNIESWVDIHDCSENGKLVFVTDSGGHPRYRRTVLRGLMNWAPHWSILCIAADDAEGGSSSNSLSPQSQQLPGCAPIGVDFVLAHLSLSLKLDVPMAIVITKLDLASKSSLKQTMAKILTAIKEAGRIPKILQASQTLEDELSQVPAEDADKVQGLVDLMAGPGGTMKYVPILLISSVKGTGIGLVHALLQALPVPPKPTVHDLIGHALNPEQPKCLFHIDDTFNLPAAYCTLAECPDNFTGQGVVVSGHLRFGSLSIGDEIIVGPFPAEDDESNVAAPEDRPSPGGYGLSISHPSSAELAKIAMKNAISASSIAGEWHKAYVVSVRNLRLPVRTLEAGQAGSVGLVLNSSDKRNTAHIRRGMVLAIPQEHMANSGVSLQAASGFTASFNELNSDTLVVGSFVNVYVASVRATARVLGITYCHPDDVGRRDDLDEIFSLNEDTDDDRGHNQTGNSSKRAEVFLELLHTREWIELGSKVILMEGGSQDRSGLEGYVGNIVEIVD